MEEVEDVKYTNSSLHYFIQQYKHIKHFYYQRSQTLIILIDDTKSVKCDLARRKRRYLLQRQIVKQEFKFPPAFFPPALFPPALFPALFLVLSYENLNFLHSECLCIFVLKTLNNSNIRVMEAQRITFQFVS